MGLIYVVKNKINGKHYIGQTIQKWPRRKQQHFNNPGRSSAIDQALQKYGKENFKWKIIDESDDQELLNMLEKLHISRYESSIDDWGYNIKEGGSNGMHSKETRNKISEANKRRKYSEETRKKIGEGNKGKIMSLEARKKMSKARKGKKKSEEHKRKISQALKGRKYSKNTKKKMSKAQYKRKKGLFGFVGASYTLKKQKPWTRVWVCQIGHNGNTNYLGVFHDPLSAQIVYNFAWNEIYS